MILNELFESGKIQNLIAFGNPIIDGCFDYSNCEINFLNCEKTKVLKLWKISKYNDFGIIETTTKEILIPNEKLTELNVLKSCAKLKGIL